MGHKENQIFSQLKSSIVGTTSVTFCFYDVSDTQAVQESLESTAATLKEILLDLGPDFKDSVESVEIKVTTEGKDVRLTLDVSANQFLGEFLASFRIYL